MQELGEGAPQSVQEIASCGAGGLTLVTFGGTCAARLVEILGIVSLSPVMYDL